MDRKTLYKIELLYVKYSPIIISIGLLLNNILAYNDIYINVVGGYLYGVSLLGVGHFYISSFAFKFCKYHRMFIHYIVVNNSLNAVDTYYNITVTDKQLLFMYLSIAGVFLFLILHYYRKYGDREI